MIHSLQPRDANSYAESVLPTSAADAIMRMRTHNNFARRASKPVTDDAMANVRVVINKALQMPKWDAMLGNGLATYDGKGMPVMNLAMMPKGPQDKPERYEY